MSPGQLADYLGVDTAISWAVVGLIVLMCWRLWRWSKQRYRAHVQARASAFSEAVAGAVATGMAQALSAAVADADASAAASGGNVSVHIGDNLARFIADNYDGGAHDNGGADYDDDGGALLGAPDRRSVGSVPDTARRRASAPRGAVRALPARSPRGGAPSRNDLPGGRVG